MKRSLIMLFIMLIVCVSCLTVWAADPNDPNSIEYKENEIVTMVKQLPQKQIQLNDKVYSGTIEEVLAARLVDINEVIEYSKQIETKANSLVSEVNITPDKGSAIKLVIQRFNDRSKNEEQKCNNEFLKAVHDSLNDPNVVPEPNDQNYADTIAIHNEILAFCIEIVDPR